MCSLINERNFCDGHNKNNYATFIINVCNTITGNIPVAPINSDVLKLVTTKVTSFELVDLFAYEL